jgi:hypothetical protein
MICSLKEAKLRLFFLKPVLQLKVEKTDTSVYDKENLVAII